MVTVTVLRLEGASPALLALADRLSPGEWERLEQKKRAADRYCSLCAALLARVLARERFDTPNHRLIPSLGDKGKPWFPALPDFHYSLTHTAGALASTGAVAAAVAHRPVGVDAERLRPANHRVAERFFTPRETAFIRAVEGAEGDRRFFQVWTRKEACIKMTGQGLSTPLSSFDCLAEPWAGRLVTAEWDGLVLSCCCERPEPVHFVPRTIDWLLVEAAGLEVY